MQILCVAPKFDYSIPARGPGFEYTTFAQTFARLGYDVGFFDFGTYKRDHGLVHAGRRLREIVRAEKPPLTFFVLTGDQLRMSDVRAVSESGCTTTVNWYCDDHFNFESFSTRWTPAFNWVVTTSQAKFPLYGQHGFTNVIKSQWACNHFDYHPVSAPLEYDVTFVGAAHGNRRDFVDAVRAAGFRIDCWGSGWPNGRADHAQMLRIFGASRINLNFTNGASVPRSRDVWKIRTRDYINGRLGDCALGRSMRDRWAAWRTRRSSATPAPPHTPYAGPLEQLVNGGIPQIKGRTFEIPGCGGFMLSGDAENLADYYADGVDAALFANGRQLIDRIGYYLKHEDERAAIAQRGYRRTMAEHTYAHRFHEIFARIGVPGFDLAAALAQTIRPGAICEVD